MKRSAVMLAALPVLVLAMGGRAWAQPGITAEIGAGIIGMEASIGLRPSRFAAIRGNFNFLSNDLLATEQDFILGVLPTDVGTITGIVPGTDASVPIRNLIELSNYNFDSYGILIDLHPFGGSFRITGGYTWGQGRGIGLMASGGALIANGALSGVIDGVARATRSAALGLIETHINDASFLAGANLTPGDLNNIRGFVRGQFTVDTAATVISNSIDSSFQDISADIGIAEWVPYVGFGWSGTFLGPIGMFLNIGCYLMTPSQLTASIGYTLSDNPVASYDISQAINDAHRANINGADLLQPGSEQVDFTALLPEVTRQLDLASDQLLQEFRNLVADSLPVVPLPVISVGLTLRFY